MDKQKAYSTHEIAEAKMLHYYFLRGIDTALETIYYSTFYYAEIYTYILITHIIFCKSSQYPLSVYAGHKLDRILASDHRNLFRKLN